MWPFSMLSRFWCFLRQDRGFSVPEARTKSCLIGCDVWLISIEQCLFHTWLADRYPVGPGVQARRMDQRWHLSSVMLIAQISLALSLGKHGIWPWDNSAQVMFGQWIKWTSEPENILCPGELCLQSPNQSFPSHPLYLTEATWQD